MVWPSSLCRDALYDSFACTWRWTVTNERRGRNASAEVRLMGSDLGRLLAKGAPFAVLLALVGALAAYLDVSRDAPVFEATAVLLSAPPPPSVGGVEIVAPSAVDPRVYQRIIMEGSIPAEVLEDLTGSTPTDDETLAFKRDIRIEIEDYKPLTSIVRIGVRGSDQELVALEANMLAQKLIEWDRSRAERAIEDAIEAMEASIANLDATIASTVSQGDAEQAQRVQATSATLREQLVRELEVVRSRKSGAVYASTLVQMVAADKDGSPVGPRAFLKTLVAAVSMLVLAYAIQFAYWASSKSVGSAERLASLVDLPVLGALAPGALGGVWTRDPFARARTMMLSAPSKFKPRVLGIMSPTSFDEKRGIAFGLGRSLVAAGYRTVVLDGDLKRAGLGYAIDPSRHKTTTLQEHLVDPSKTVVPATILFASGAELDVIPGLIPAELGASDLDVRLSRFLNTLGETYDVIVIDIPPVLTSVRGTEVGPHCAATIMTVGASTNMADVTEALSVSNLVGVNMIGTLFTMRDWPKRRLGASVRRQSGSPGGDKEQPGRSRSARETRSIARVQQRR